ncbi:MAG: acyl-CoA dehydratase activase, partial [Planctomycetota bacterium]
MYLGIDIGSVAVKVVVLDKDLKVKETQYVRSHGQPFETTLAVLKDVFTRHNPEYIEFIAATGTGGKHLSSFTSAVFVNEITAQATGTSSLHPKVKTIIEIGGEDAKIIKVDSYYGPEIIGTPPPLRKAIKVTDFATNSACAAGTGSFLDQQASRMGIKIEDVGQAALNSKHPATVAARCSVFAKSDMIHLQQVGTSIGDILAGLCFAMARNFKSSITKGINIEKPIAFQGGVAANQGMVRAFREILQIDEKDIIVPEHFAFMGAIGSVLSLVHSYQPRRIKGMPVGPSKIIKDLERYLSERKLDLQKLAPLKNDDYVIRVEPYPTKTGEKVEAYVGVDVGSISTNVVVIDNNNNVLARRYLMTAGQPIEAVRKGLLEVGAEIADKVIIKGAGSTGSGRHLTGEFFGADVIKNEITSHARAAVAVDPQVDTIFEIGGQDSKYISLKDGVVVDFTMNKVCAAGTGSFLEEQAEKLAVKINQEFAERAFCSDGPCSLGERCTVFMESQLNYYKQQGVAKNDLISGLAYSIVENYLNKVVERRKVGDHILFQGGVGFNRAVKNAFEQVTGKKVIVPPHHDILGAVGAAILAKEEMAQRAKSITHSDNTFSRSTLFKGFDLKHIQYESSSFECTDCPNNCEIHKIKFSEEHKAKSIEHAKNKTLHYGSRCGKYDDTEDKQSAQHLKAKSPNYFKERQKVLLQSTSQSVGQSTCQHTDRQDDRQTGRPTIGIPRISVFYDLYPLWHTFFSELGLEIVLSDDTNRSIIKKGVENVVAEPCFPVKTAHGHIINVLEKGIDYLFIPFQVNMPPLSKHFDRSYNCPYIQALPDTTRSAIDYKKYDTKIIRPVFHMDRGRKEIEKTLKQIGKSIKHKTNNIDRCMARAFEAQERFDRWQTERGQEVLSGNAPALVLVTRSYNSYDTGLNLNLSEKLRKLGMTVIPIDFLPMKEMSEEIGRDYPYMYWRSGQKILAAARYIGRTKNLFAVYLTNFNCGPDSYITKFFEKEMHGKPYLSLEIDEHSADVGMQTRCEAFIDTIKHAHNLATTSSHPSSTVPLASLSRDARTIYIPYMDDHGFIIAAAFRSAGIDAQALPPSDDESLVIGRKYTSGRECFPSIITTGDIVKKINSPDFKPERSAFFMPSAKGPCRFGQYNKLHRMVLDEIGLPNVPIITFDQTADFHKDMAVLGSAKFKKNIWRGLVLLDLLQKLSRETRPYETTKGETNRVYAETFKNLQKFIESAPNKKSNIEDFTKDAVKRFDEIKTDYSEPKPKIGIIGEIYVRSNPFTNNYAVAKLEELGAEVALPPFEEWLDYIDYIREEDYLLENDYLNYIKQKITLVFQEREANKIRKHFHGKIRNFHYESSTAVVIKHGSVYIDPALRGEAVLSLGRAEEYAHAGFNGIINIIPFGCMPGNIVTALLKRFKDEYNIPVLTMTVDGIKNPGEEMRLEAFVR